MTEGTLNLRWNDYSLTSEEESVSELFEQFFERNSSSAVVRAAEPEGFDADLWAKVVSVGGVSMAVPEDRGGEGGGIVELVLAAEQAGYHLAPVPLGEHVVATRLLARLQGPGIDDAIADALTGEGIVAIAAAERWGPDGQLLSYGSIASKVVGLVDGALVLISRSTPPKGVANLACLPLGRWSLEDPEVTVATLAEGESARTLFNQLLDEWRVVKAATLSGLAAGAEALALRCGIERSSFGVPIATFQAISHILVDIDGEVRSGRNLHRKAAWFLANEPDAFPALPAMALANAAKVALFATKSSVHVHGGLGITLETDTTLYFQRAASWAWHPGGRTALLSIIADSVPHIADAQGRSS